MKRLSVLAAALFISACNGIQPYPTLPTIVPAGPQVGPPFLMTVSTNQCLIPTPPEGFLGTLRVTVLDERGNQLADYPITWSTTAGRFRAATATTRISVAYAELITERATDKPIVTITAGDLSRQAIFLPPCSLTPSGPQAPAPPSTPAPTTGGL